MKKTKRKKKDKVNVYHSRVIEKKILLCRRRDTKRNLYAALKSKFPIEEDASASSLFEHESFGMKEEARD